MRVSTSNGACMIRVLGASSSLWLIGGGLRLGLRLRRGERLLDGDGVDLRHVRRQRGVHQPVSLQQTLPLELFRHHLDLIARAAPSHQSIDRSITSNSRVRTNRIRGGKSLGKQCVLTRQMYRWPPEIVETERREQLGFRAEIGYRFAKGFRPETEAYEMGRAESGGDGGLHVLLCDAHGWRLPPPRPSLLVVPVERRQKAKEQVGWLRLVPLFCVLSNVYRIEEFLMFLKKEEEFLMWIWKHELACRNILFFLLVDWESNLVFGCFLSPGNFTKSIHFKVDAWR